MDLTSTNANLPEAEFRNPDGSPASWLAVLPVEVRRKAFLWRAGIGLTIALAFWSVQYANGALDLDRGWVPLIPLGLGLVFGNAAYRTGEVRRYSTTYVRYSRTQRLKRAWKWLAFGAGALALIWSLQLADDHFAQYWYYAWPVLPPLLVGLGLYLLRGEATLTPVAAKAKSHFEAGVQQQAQDKRAEPTALDRFVETPLARYGLAALCLYGTYYFAAVDTRRNSGWAAIGCLVVAGFLAREVSKWVLGLALAGVAIWALVAGISALPVSAAIIIGALIIASALKS